MGIARRKKPDPASLLWREWEKTLRRNRRRIVLIDAGRDLSWTAEALDAEVEPLLDLLVGLEPGARIATCLPNGAPWLAWFLALQKRGLAAMPLDASLPAPAAVEMARRLGCAALFFEGKWHPFDVTGRGRTGICCVKVTSGTSGGLPKSVPCRAEHLLADGTNIVRSMGLREQDRHLVTIPLGHSYGLGNFVMPLLQQGASLVCAAPFVPRQLIEWIGRHRVTVFPSVPAIFRILATLPTDSSLKPLRLAISAGAPLTPEVARTFFERYRIRIHNFYGSSETGGICYDRLGHASLAGRSVGQPLAGVTVKIERGAIRVASNAVAKRSGSWRMPDRGEWNDRSELVLLGRQGREANLGGKKVHPSEVEQALRRVPGITDAVVWVATHAGRSFLHAAVETTLPLAEIQRAVAITLPDWKHPKRYLLKAELPRTGRGKIDLPALRRESEKMLGSEAR